MAEKKKKKATTRAPGWMDTNAVGGAMRIMDAARALKGATPKPPKKKKK